MTNREEKDFPPAQREPGRRGRMGGVVSRPCSRGNEAISSLGKGRCFLPRKQRGCRFLIWGRSSSPRRVQPQHFSFCLDEEYGALEERALQKGAKRATKKSPSPHWGHVDRTKDRCSATYVDEAALPGQTSKSSTSTLSIRGPTLKHRRPWPKDQRGFRRNPAGGHGDGSS
ncbi:hypothetical protein GWK47_045067 [Chionoecetes opilio]|uniref:Uncharacterized protein n=1 Tax=Chionoecetes opilio TaxID=41210 RepID=A0A8J4YEB3_CHIOP|nr:hypothetical protein GWK47_045067 [Chionoecetes opilio]